MIWVLFRISEVDVQRSVTQVNITYNFELRDILLSTEDVITLAKTSKKLFS